MNYSEDIITQLQAVNLVGCGGASFPTGDKWRMVQAESADRRYIVCNGTEGEPGVFKDGYILQHHQKEFLEGVKIALQVFENSEAYICLNSRYFQQFSEQLKKASNGWNINIFHNVHGYLSGEETALCEVIEGKRPMVRNKPPFPSQAGLWGFPTLVNNVETFYRVYQVANGCFKEERFFSISGAVKSVGVWEFSANATVRQILLDTNNYPDFDFFVQVGGGASGEIWLESELDREIHGVCAIVVYDKNRTDLYDLMSVWINFFLQENCDKCVPCREGAYRLAEMITKKQIDKVLSEELFFSLQNSSFCALGRDMSRPFQSLINKLL